MGLCWPSVYCSCKQCIFIIDNDSVTLHTWRTCECVCVWCVCAVITCNGLESPRCCLPPHLDMSGRWDKWQVTCDMQVSLTVVWHICDRCHLTGARADCQFPTYLLTNSSDNTDFWHLADRYDGTYLTVRFRQSEATISYLPLNDTTPLHSNITCLAMDGEYTVVNITTLRYDVTLTQLRYRIANLELVTNKRSVVSVARS